MSTEKVKREKGNIFKSFDERMNQDAEQLRHDGANSQVSSEILSHSKSDSNAEVSFDFASPDGKFKQEMDFHEDDGRNKTAFKLDLDLTAIKKDNDSEDKEAQVIKIGKQVSKGSN